MVFEQLGEPIKFGEYMYRYEEMICHILKEMTFIDFASEQVKTLLRAEMRKAEAAFYIFYDQNHREPDYGFLQRRVTEFGVERLSFFTPEPTVLSVDHFVLRYIERLKNEKLLSGLVFHEQDLFFIEKYEQRRAENYFEEQNEYLPGYEKERISINEQVQQLAYQKLKNEFLENPFIASLKKEQRGE